MVEEKIKIEYSKEELLDELTDLEGDKEIELFLKVERGMRKFKRYSNIAQILEKNSKK